MDLSKSISYLLQDDYRLTVSPNAPSIRQAAVSFLPSTLQESGRGQQIPGCPRRMEGIT